MKSLSINTILFIIFFQNAFAHPIHISLANIEFVPENKCFHIIIKLDKEDFSNIIYHYYGINFDSTFNAENKLNIKAINSYINNNFEFKLNKKTLKTEFQKISFNNESVWIKYKTVGIKKTNQITIKNTLLNDLFYDQTNLVIFKYHDYENGYQLTYNENTIEINLPDNLK